MKFGNDNVQEIEKKKKVLFPWSLIGCGGPKDKLIKRINSQLEPRNNGTGRCNSDKI